MLFKDSLLDRWFIIIIIHKDKLQTLLEKNIVNIYIYRLLMHS